MMKNRQTRSLISLILAITMLLTGSMLVYAVDLSDLFGDSAVTELQLDADCQILKYVDEEVFLDGGHVARLKEEETLSTYVFLNSDGTRTVYYMDENVKFRDENGAVQEKDISLTATTQGFATTRNDVALSLPANLAQGVTMSYGGYDVTLIPQNISTSTTVRQQDGSVLYANCFGHNTGLIYTPTLSGLKEDILLGKYTGVNSFTFLLNTDGLNVYQNEQGRYYLAQSADAEMKMEMADIVAYDANTRHCLGEMTVTPITAGQQYQLTVTIDEDFLTAETTAYPVLIDPTITVSDNTHGAGAIEDSTIYSGKTSLNTATWQYNRVGYDDDNYKYGRTVIRLANLINDPTYQSLAAYQLQSVLFYIKEGTGTAGTPAYLYSLTASFEENKTNWRDTSGYTGQLYDAETLVNNVFAVFDITTLAQSWKTGSTNSNGMFVLIGDETTKVDKAVYSSEFNATDRRPYVVVNYVLPNSVVNVNEGSTATLSSSGITGTITWSSDNTAVATVNSSGVVSGHKAGKAIITATVGGVLQKTYVVYVTIPDGTYLIYSKGGNGYLGAEEISYANNTKLYVQNRDTDTVNQFRQVWKIQHHGNGYYTIGTVYKDNLWVYSPFGYTASLSNGTNPSPFLWEIKWKTGANTATSGYVFTRRSGSSDALAVVDKEEDSVGILSSTNQGQDILWSFTPITPSGILLLDSETGERIDYATNTAKIVLPPSSGTTWVDRSDLGVDVKAITSGSSSPIVSWSLDNDDVAAIDMWTGAMSVKAAGSVIITASYTAGENTYSNSYKLSVPQETVTTTVLYDAEYLRKFPNTQSRLNEYMEKIQSVYAFYLNKNVTVSVIQQYASPPDECPGIAAGQACSCGTCPSTPQKNYSNYACTHLSRILAEIPVPTSTDKCIAFIGHDTCDYSANEHSFNSEGGSILGWGYINGNRACVSTTTLPNANPNEEQLTALHEYGHMLGAWDHYGGSQPSTDEVNQKYSKLYPNAPSNPFNRACVYGEDRFNDPDGFYICEGCQKVFAGEISFPALCDEELD